MAIDGVVLTFPDSDANSRAFGRANAGPQGQAVFPQLRKLSLMEAGIHAELAFVVRGIHAPGGEQGMTPALLKHIQAGMLLLWDSGFYSFALWQQACATGAQLLARLSSTLTLPILKGLPDGSYLPKVYPSWYARQKDRGGQWVRVIRYTHKDPQGVNYDEEPTSSTGC